MPLARIITRAVEESQELAAELRGRGYEVEIVPPSALVASRADVEFRLEECTPEEALIRAGVLPDTNEMAVFIAPGAIAGRRMPLQSDAGKVSSTTKWYELPPESPVPDLEAMNLPLGSLEQVAAAALVEPRIVLADESQSLKEGTVQPTGNASVEKTCEDGKLAKVSGLTAGKLGKATSPAGAVGGSRTPLWPVSAPRIDFATRVESLMTRLAAVTPIMRVNRWPARRTRLTLPIARSFWKGAVIFACLGVALYAMGWWVHRKAPVPAGFGSVQVQSDAAPGQAADARVTTPEESVKPPNQKPSETPPQANESSLMPQAATAMLPEATAKAPASPKAVRSKRKAEDKLVADDVSRRIEPTRPLPPKPDPNDGIKRYSDLD